MASGNLKISIDTEDKTPVGLIKADRAILKLGLAGMTKALDELLTGCMREEGPSRQEIARARGMLPAGYENSFQPKQNIKES